MRSKNQYLNIESRKQKPFQVFTKLSKNACKLVDNFIKLFDFSTIINNECNIKIDFVKKSLMLNIVNSKKQITSALFYPEILKLNMLKTGVANQIRNNLIEYEIFEDKPDEMNLFMSSLQIKRIFSCKENFLIVNCDGESINILPVSEYIGGDELNIKSYDVCNISSATLRLESNCIENTYGELESKSFDIVFTPRFFENYKNIVKRSKTCYLYLSNNYDKFYFLPKDSHEDKYEFEDKVLKLSKKHLNSFIDLKNLIIINKASILSKLNFNENNNYNFYIQIKVNKFVANLNPSTIYKDIFNGEFCDDSSNNIYNCAMFFKLRLRNDKEILYTLTYSNICENNNNEWGIYDKQSSMEVIGNFKLHFATKEFTVALKYLSDSNKKDEANIIKRVDNPLNNLNLKNYQNLLNVKSNHENEANLNNFSQNFNLEYDKSSYILNNDCDNLLNNDIISIKNETLPSNSININDNLNSLSEIEIDINKKDYEYKLKFENAVEFFKKRHAIANLRDEDDEENENFEYERDI